MDADAGRFPTGKAGLARDWDGHAWAPTPVLDPAVAAVPKGGHFVLRSWPFWLAVVLAATGVVLAVVAADPSRPIVWLFAVAGFVACGGTLIALTIAVWRRLRIRDAIRAIGSKPHNVIGFGILSGIVAVVLAFVVETQLAKLGIGGIGGLFLAGPVEETMKLLVPVLIFYLSRKRWRDPRVAFGLAWMSGVTFGILEGVEYVLGIDAIRVRGELSWLFDDVVAVRITLERVFTELMHPLLTGAAAAGMWLGAWRGKRLLLGSGLVAYLTAMFMHSFNDGVIAGLLAQVASSLSIYVLFPLWLVAIYQVFRLRARELVPPSRIATSQPRWRPHVQHAARVQAARSAPAPGQPASTEASGGAAPLVASAPADKAAPTS